MWVFYISHKLKVDSKFKTNNNNNNNFLQAIRSNRCIKRKTPTTKIKTHFKSHEINQNQKPNLPKRLEKYSPRETKRERGKKKGKGGVYK